MAKSGNNDTPMMQQYQAAKAAHPGMLLLFRMGDFFETFGEDAELARNLVKAYVEGFQHGASGVDSAGVLAVVKHWVGYGAQKNGLDSHSYYGRFANFSGANLNLHVSKKGLLSGFIGRSFQSSRAITYTSGIASIPPRTESDFWTGSLQLSWEL